MSLCVCGKECKGENGLKIHKARYCTFSQEGSNDIVEKPKLDDGEFKKGDFVQHKRKGDKFRVEFVDEQGRIARRVNARPEGIKLYNTTELNLA